MPTAFKRSEHCSNASSNRFNPTDMPSAHNASTATCHSCSCLQCCADRFTRTLLARGTCGILHRHRLPLCMVTHCTCPHLGVRGPPGAPPQQHQPPPPARPLLSVSAQSEGPGPCRGPVLRPNGSISRWAGAGSAGRCALLHSCHARRTGRGAAQSTQLHGSTGGWERLLRKGWGAEKGGAEKGGAKNKGGASMGGGGASQDA